jgi:DNA replication licensing factor MCM6
VEVQNFRLGFDTFSAEDHNKKVEVKGKINTANIITPELSIATFKCDNCGKIYSLSQGGGKCKLLRPETCINKKCKNKKPNFTFIQGKSKFEDYQEAWLKPLEDPKIRIGRGQKIILKNDLVGVKEGEIVRVTGKLGFELKGRTTFARPIVIATKIKYLD